MQPAFALARARLAETKEEFDSFLEAEREQLALLEGDSRKSAEWMRAVTRASGVEGRLHRHGKRLEGGAQRHRRRRVWFPCEFSCPAIGSSRGKDRQERTDRHAGYVQKAR